MDDELLRAAVRLAISLPLVAVLAYGVIKYGLGRRTLGMRKQRYMQVIEQMPLGPKISLSLVRIGDKYYVLAHQDGSTVLITQLNDMPEEIHKEQIRAPGSMMKTITQKRAQREKNSHEE